MFGKILRIDPLGTTSQNGQYGVPADNPFVDGPGGNVDEIFAYGLRNPYRLALDESTTQLYAIETGELSVESVNAIVAGGNHGWNLKEGSFVYDPFTKTIRVDVDADENGVGDVAQANGLIDPVLEYGRVDGIAITGVAPYAGDALPHLAGQLVLSEFSGQLMRGDPNDGVVYELLADETGVAMPDAIHSLNQDANGEVYVLGIVKDENAAYRGVIYRLESADWLAGDLARDAQLDVADLDVLSTAITLDRRKHEQDLNGDSFVDASDIAYWVEQLNNTYVGDANLDGEFNSRDIVDVFVQNEYEDNVARNSNWSDGDWNGDSEFTSSDLVAAFSRGGYEQGPRAVAVPEPTSCLVWLLGAALMVRCGRR